MNLSIARSEGEDCFSNYRKRFAILLTSWSGKINTAVLTNKTIAQVYLKGTTDCILLNLSCPNVDFEITSFSAFVASWHDFAPEAHYLVIYCDCFHVDKWLLDTSQLSASNKGSIVFNSNENHTQRKAWYAHLKKRKENLHITAFNVCFLQAIKLTANLNIHNPSCWGKTNFSKKQINHKMCSTKNIQKSSVGQTKDNYSEC